MRGARRARADRGEDLCLDEGVLSLLFLICCSCGYSAYKQERGRNNDRIPSSKSDRRGLLEPAVLDVHDELLLVRLAAMRGGSARPETAPRGPKLYTTAYTQIGAAQASG